jgi:hypothetical protein
LLFLRAESERVASLRTAGYPNLYTVTGPNTGVATTSVVYMVEAQVGYILQCIEAAGRDKPISPRPEAMEQYNTAIQAEVAETVWTSGCDSWYLGEGGDGKISTLYPGTATRFRSERERLDLSEFELTEIPNACHFLIQLRFSFLVGCLFDCIILPRPTRNREGHPGIRHEPTRL